MGLFYDRNVGFPVTLSINLDEAALPPLGCRKNSVQFVQDFVERCPAIARIVMYSCLLPGLNGSPTDQQLILMVEHVQDANAMVAGMALEWVDCCTQFLDLTPAGAAAGRYILRMEVLPLGSLRGRHVPASLLV